jgi:DnaK suppressor protein
MSPSSPSFLHTLRGRLEQRMALLTDQISARREQVTEDPPPVHGMGDLGDVSIADANRDLDFSEAERDADEVRAIQAVLRRIEEGGYGVCVQCGIDIAPQRLAAQPLALRCLECQRAFEHAAALRAPTL